MPLSLFLLTGGSFVLGWAKPVPFNPYNLRNQRWGEALVAVAGPISNIALAILFGLTIRFLPEYINVSQSFLNLASSVVLINIILAIFNLIPIPPLDGSKILFAFLPYKWQTLRQSFERFGLILVFIFILFIWQIMSHIIGFIFTLLTGIAF